MPRAIRRESLLLGPTSRGWWSGLVRRPLENTIQHRSKNQVPLIPPIVPETALVQIDLQIFPADRVANAADPAPLYLIGYLPSFVYPPEWLPATRPQLGQRERVSSSPPRKNFHRSTVTSDLALKKKSRNHGRGGDGWQEPTGRSSKFFVSKILISKFFDIRILAGISC
jgi:hypothetical protein